MITLNIYSLKQTAHYSSLKRWIRFEIEYIIQSRAAVII